MSSRDTLNAIDNLMKKRKERDSKESTLVSKKTTHSNDTKEDVSSNSRATLNAIDNLMKSRKAASSDKSTSTLKKLSSVANPATEEKSSTKTALSKMNSKTLPNGINRATALAIANAVVDSTEPITRTELNKVISVAPRLFPELSNIQNELSTTKKELEQLQYDKENKYTDEYWNSVYEAEFERLSKEFGENQTTSIFDALDGKGATQTGAGADAVANTVAQKNAVNTKEAELKKAIMDLESAEKLYQYSAVAVAPDFEDYAKKGADEIDSRAYGNVMLGDDLGNALATEQEAKVYNYLYAKYGKDTAEDYYNGLNLILTQRQGENDAKWLDNIEIPVLEELATGAHGLATGAESWFGGVGDFFSGQPHKTTRSEAAQQYVMENLADDGFKIGDMTSSQMMYQGTITVGNMLPSIAISYATSGIASGLGASAGTASKIGSVTGNVAMGVSSAGSARAQALAEGYDADQALVYGILVGASEATLQELLGGISSLGGVNETRIMAKLQAVDNAFLRVAGTSAYKALSEITEEELQLFLEPLFRTVVFNEEYDAPEAGEMIETALVTFLSTGALESGSTISTAKGNGKLGEDIIKEGVGAVTDTIQQGLQAPVGSASRMLAEELNAAMKNDPMQFNVPEEISAHKLGTLADMLAQENTALSDNEKEGEKYLSSTFDAPATLEEAAMARAMDTESDKTEVNSKDNSEVDNLPTEVKAPEATAFNVLADTTPTNEIGAVTESTRSILRSHKMVVSSKDGKTYLGDGIVAIPVKAEDGETAKANWGAKDSANLANSADELANDSGYTRISAFPKRATLPGYGKVVLFTDDEGREIAIQEKYAKYFDGYEFSATFTESGLPNAVKATDKDGNLAGVVKAIRPDNNGVYNVTDVKEANMKSFPRTTTKVEAPNLSAVPNVLSNEAYESVTAKRKANEDSFRKLTGMGDYGVSALVDVVDSLPEGDISRVVQSFKTAYDVGFTDTPTSKVSFTTEVQRAAFEAGKKDAIMKAPKDEENVKNVKSHGKNAGFDSSNAPSNTTPEQSRILNKLYKAFGVVGGYGKLSANAELKDNIGVATIADDYQDKAYDSKGNLISVSAVYHGIHEVALHRLMELAPKEGRAFVNALYRYMSKDGAVDLASVKRAEYAEQGKNISTSLAMEEIAANTILELYNLDEKAFERALDRIIAENGTLAQKGAYKFKQILDKIITWFKSLGSKEKQAVQEDIDKITELRDLLERAMSAAVAKNKEIAKSDNLVTMKKDGTIVDKKGNVVAKINDDGTASFSLRTFDDSGRAELKKWLDRNVKNKKLTQEEANDIAEQLEYYYDICKKYEDKYAPFSAWSKAEVVKGLDGKPLMSVVKTNGDYKMNLDFSLVCKKRRPLDALYRAMIDDGFMDNIGQLSEVEVATINEIIRENGFETACTLCFVDSKRYRQYAVAENFVSKYNELVKMLAPEGAKIDRFDFSGKRATSAEGLHTMSDADLKSGINKLNKVIKEQGESTVVAKIAKHLKAVPSDRKLVTISDFMDSEGFVRVSKSNPNVLKLYNMSKGSGGPKATLPDVQYLGEILKKQNFTPKKAYAVGGVRVQSFSDYIPRLVFDYLQMTADLTAKKLPAHAYSKEDIFVMQFGKTGIKINMSLVPAIAKDGIAPGLDKDGNYVWVDGHTFASDFHDKGSGQRGFELAIKIQNTEGYGQNCGTIAVGVSNEHIVKMLKDKNIRMVIPYHKSSLNHFVAQMGNIKQYEDYTPVQNTRDRKTVDSRHPHGKKIEGKDFNFNEAFHRLGDAKAATNEYLAWCEKHDYIPKFDYFAFHEDAEVRENYYKLLIDFSAYDSNGNATPQGAVTMNFPTESDAFGSMSSLIEKGLEADAILEGRKEKQIPKILNQVKSELAERAKANREALEMSDSKTKYSLRTKEPPKKTQEVYKLMRLENGQIYPLFIDSTEPLKVGTWYDADSPNLDFLKDLPSGIFLVDSETETYVTYEDYLKESGEKKTKKPSKKAIEKAAAEGKRWVWIEDTAKGQKRFGGETRRYWNLGINGSGAVSEFSMRPGYHAGSLPTMRQIGKGANKDLRDDKFVWTVGEVPADINYQDEANRNPDKDIPTHIPVDGYYLKATNADKAKSQADVVGWYVAGSYKINRIISDSEARSIIDKWNAEHPDAQALYDYERESGMDFDAEQMKLVPRETAQKNTDLSDGGVKLSLRNKNLTKDSRIPYTTLDGYIAVVKNDQAALDRLESAVESLQRGVYTNKATEYRAAITDETISKAIHPTHKPFNRFKESHLLNLNATLKLPELFAQAVYVDSKDPKKTKNAGKSIQKYHYFVAPMLIGKDTYRAVITAREKTNSNTLYFVRVDVLPIQKKAHPLATQQNAGGSQWLDVPLDVSIPELVNGVNILNYDTGIREFYFDRDIKYSLRQRDSEYMSAVEKGDTETAQRIVKEAASESGYTIRAYHGTSKGGFTWFDTYAYYSKFGLFGNGAYFTENKDIAEEYTKKGRGNNPQVYSVYLGISNPIDMDVQADIDAWNKAIQKSGEDLDLLQGEMTNEQAFRRIVEELEDLEVYSYDGAEIVRNIFENMGYNGITHMGGGRVNSDGVKHRVWIAFEPEQIKSADTIVYDDDGNIIPISERFNSKKGDIRYSLRRGKDGALSEYEKLTKALADNDVDTLVKYVDEGIVSTEYYNQLIEEYGAIPKGEKPHRDIQVPQKTAEDKKVSQTVRTILEAKVTPDEAVPTIEKMVEDGVFSYEVYGDKKAIANAEKYIEKYGWDDSLDDWFDAINKGEVSKDMTTVGWMLYNNATNTAANATTQEEKQTATRTALKILDAMVRHQRNAAQALQATRILKKLSPETQLYGVQKSVQAFQKELEERYGDKAPDLKIDEGLAEEFLEAKTPEERAEVEKKIYKDIGRQMPSRFIDKWNAWRYLAMLGNVKTHGRNVVGNAAFAPVVNIKNVIAIGLESAVHKVSGGKTARSKTFLNPKSQADRDLIKAAYEDYANVADAISNGGKYNDSAMANQAIEDGRRIFKNKLLEGARKGNSWLLEQEDILFAKPHYAYALAMYCKANKITAEQLRKGKALGNARQYAIKEAQKATYRDMNAFSQFVSRLGRSDTKKNPITKGASTIIEGILPFRKTPANILVRGLEYSPLGFIRGIKQAVWDVKRGKKTSAEAIDSISAGLTGTGLMLLGMFLSNLELIRGHGEDEEEEKEFNEMMGHQAYALELPNGTSITLDWLAPEALPFFVGVNLAEKMRSEDEELTMSTILQTASGITEPMIEMSCLQGVNDLVEGIGYASSNDTSAGMAILSSAVTSYLLQGLPTIGGQIERTTEEHRMTTYTEKNDFLTGDMQYTLGKASAKIPLPYVDYHQIPYIDAWGRKEVSGSALKRGFDNFLNPAYTSTIETSEMEKELLRLYEQTGDSAVLPSRADKYFTVDGERKDLTADEYVRYATLKGEKSYKLVTDLVKSKNYKNLSDEEKVEAISNTYDYANQKAKQAVSNYKPDTWISEADKFGANVGNYISFKTEVASTKKANDNKISRHQVVDIVQDTAQNDTEAWEMYLSVYDNEGAKYAREEGVSGETYLAYLDNLGDVSDGKTVKKSEAVDAIQKLDLDSDDSWAIYLSEFDDSGAKMAKQYGVKGDKYIDYRDYLDKVDEYYAKKKRAEEGNPDDELSLGSYTQDEVEVALDMVKGLSQRDKAIIWQSMNKQWKTKNNPYL